MHEVLSSDITHQSCMKYCPVILHINHAWNIVQWYHTSVMHYVLSSDITLRSCMRYCLVILHINRALSIVRWDHTSVIFQSYFYQNIFVSVIVPVQRGTFDSVVTKILTFCVFGLDWMLMWKIWLWLLFFFFFFLMVVSIITIQLTIFICVSFPRYDLLIDTF